MKSSIFAFSALALVASTAAFAADSTWMLCANDKIAVNVYEHRVGAEDRETDVKVLIGGHLLLASQPEEATYLKAISTDQKAAFVGELFVTYGTEKAMIKGNLSIGASKAKISETLECKTLEGNLLFN